MTKLFGRRALKQKLRIYQIGIFFLLVLQMKLKLFKMNQIIHIGK